VIVKKMKMQAVNENKFYQAIIKFYQM